MARGEASWQPRVRGLPLGSASTDKGKLYKLNFDRVLVLWEMAGLVYMSLWGVREEVLWQPWVRGLPLGSALTDKGEFTF